MRVRGVGESDVGVRGVEGGCCVSCHMYVLLTPIKSSCPFRLCGPRHFRPADSSVVFSSDYSAINEKDEDKMTDSNSSNKAAPPKFSGQADDYIDWRRQFAAHMRDEKGININKRAADGTLALSDAKKVALADRLTRALGKHSILYESEQDDGVAMLAALEARFEHFSASEQRRITQKLMTLELTDPGACDDFIVEMKTLFAQLRNAGQDVNETQQIAYLLGALPDDYMPLVASVETAAGTKFADVLKQVLNFSATLALRRKRVAATTSNDALVAGWNDSRAAPNGSARSGRRVETRTCFNCGMRGHIARNCRQPPSSQRDRDRGRDSGGSGSNPWQQRRRTGNHHFANIVVNDDVTEHQAHLVDDDVPTPATMKEPQDHAKTTTMWVVDSGCTAHMCPSADEFRDYTEHVNGNVHTADGSLMKVAGDGIMDVTCVAKDGVPTTLTMRVLHVPALQFRSLSTTRIQQAGGTVVLGPSPHMRIENLVIPFQRDGDLTVLPTCNVAFVSRALLHRRLCHAGARACNATKGDSDAMDEEDDGAVSIASCTPCKAAKMRRTPFPESASGRARTPGELMHMDHAGPLVSSIEGHEYILLVVDDATRYTWAFTSTSRSDAPNALMRLNNMTPFEIKVIRTDNAPELKSDGFSAYCQEHGIMRQYSCPYTPQQNGVVERKLAHLFSLVRAMLKDAEMPSEWWSFAMRHASYVVNRTHTTALPGGVTPYEALHGTRDDPSKLRVWGCAIWVLDPRAHQKGKIVDRGIRGVFLGFASGVKGYVVFLVAERRITMSRDVEFEEEVSGGSVLGVEHNTVDTVDQIKPNRDHDIDATTARGEERNQDQSEPTANAMNDDETTCDTAGPVSPDRTTSYGRPTRAPGEWWCATAATEPTTYADAMSDPNWRAAIQEELQNHQDKGTWEIVEMPSGDINLVSTKWIFKVKSDGRHKARLVARGFTQQYGIDWHESYAPVTSTLIVRVFAAIACARALLLHHIDVRAAYLMRQRRREYLSVAPR